MNNNIGNVWMRGNKAPIVYRAASRGNAMTRNEKIRDINFQKERKANHALRKEMILEAKREVSDSRERREKVMLGISMRLENEKAKLQNKGEGVFIQTRNDKGHFAAKVEL